ncbi:MAG TPA: flavodoxin-dependent (E)-4-hydroxy-3-methylbut-2-enyl-diphosphate synthase [Chloroflexota bacterium]|nr:flavodoxin-dependent (E)-4-hydroxy-3-methylbut-2-enyl-diphosphate synthase [Chloroflexota bacterium]
MIAKRRPTRKVFVGKVAVGGDAPIRVQSMCDTDTRDVDATVAQIHRLEEAGCELIRVAVPDRKAASVLHKIKSRIAIPLIADIHFDYQLALEAIEQGVDKVRINPGNIFVKAGQKGIEAVVLAAKQAGIPLRIGVNCGSIEPRLLDKYGYPTPEAAVESALDHIRFCEELGFHDIIVSVKFSEVPNMIRAYELLSEQTDYPLHLGVTEAGTPWSGAIKSAIGIGALLAKGIGDTLRVSLTTPDKTDEVKVAYEILKALEIRAHGPMLTACPGCGRTEVDLLRLTAEVEAALKTVKTPLRVAVMGCVVNGPGEAAGADLAVVGGRGRGAIYRRGKLVRTASEDQLIPALLAEIENWKPDPEPTPESSREVIPLRVRR